MGGGETGYSPPYATASPYVSLPAPHPYSRPMIEDVEAHMPLSTRPSYHPYGTHAGGRHVHHERVKSQEWRPASPSLIPASDRWSPDNYYDLHHRHPNFAKDLISQRPHSRESSRSVQEHEDRYESFGYPSYIQRPNGPVMSRDSEQYSKKEF
jgi:hypothetical protein